MPAFVRKNYGFIWMLLSIAVFVIGVYFTVGFGRVSQPTPTVAAGTVTWDGGGGDGLWNTATNWDTNAVPDSTNDVIIIDGVTVTVATGQTADFSTLQIGQGTSSSTLTLVGNIGTGGSITIKNHGTFEQKNTTTQTITGTLTVESGGVLTHTANTSTHIYELDLSVNTFDLQSGGIVMLDSVGFGPGSLAGHGNGPGAGRYDTQNKGSGAGHGGNGGDWLLNSTTNIVGGSSYCDVTNPSTLGSSGGSARLTNTGGAGGGLLRLNVTGTATISGTITADGGAGLGTGGNNDAGAGSGGGIYINANVIAGTPQGFSVYGGSRPSGATNGGAGGGGCILLQYATTNSINRTQLGLYGGSNGYQAGGSGVALIKSAGTNGILYVDNNSLRGADTTQTTSTLTVDYVDVRGTAEYVVTSTKSLIASQSASPLAGDGTGTVRVSGGTFTATTTANFTIASTTFELWSSSIFTSSSSLNMYVTTSGTLALGYYTTSLPLTVTSLTVQSGGTATHLSNSSTQASIFNISATNVTVNSGGSINVDAKGYNVSSLASDGAGTGAGLYDGQNKGSGAGHAGEGGDWLLNSVTLYEGGHSYCDGSNPLTIGSSGGSARLTNLGGGGGGLILIAASNSVTVNGEITADGGAGAGTGGNVDAGAGAGGAINITASTISGTPTSFTATGGSRPASNSTGGAGGGGCVYLSYGSTNSITQSQVLVNGGSNGYQAGGAGTLFIKQTNSNGDFYVDNESVSGAETVQVTSTLQPNTFTVLGSAQFTVTSSKSLVLTNAASPFSGGDGTGTVRVNRGTFTPTTTASFTIASTTLELWSQATFTSSSSLSMIVSASGTLALGYFSTTSPLQVTSFTVQNRGTLTNLDNATSTAHTLSVSATTITVDSGGLVNVGSKGFMGGIDNVELGQGVSDGFGQSSANRGIRGTDDAASGGGHYGAGGTDYQGDAGGTGGYCDTTNPNTLGAGGGSGDIGYTGGDGGGIVRLTTSGALTINGTINASGGNGAGDSTNDAGGGAGGSVKLVGNGGFTLGGTVTVAGGKGGGNKGGGGGGGCIYIAYSGSYSNTGTTTVTGGTVVSPPALSPATSGGDGLLTLVSLNSAPTATTPTVSTTTDGTGYISVSTSVDDGDDNSVSLKVEYKSGSCAAYSGQVTTTLSSTVTATYGQSSIVLNNNASNGYQISTVTTTSGVNTVGFTWLSDTDVPSGDSTYCIFVTPTDGTTAGTTVSSTVTLDNVSPSSLGNLTATGNTGTTLTLSYGASATDTHEPSSNAYRVYYKQGSSGVTTSDTEIDSTNFDHYNYGGGTSVTVSSLSLDTQYVFNIYAYDTYGNSTSATEVATTTRANTPDTPFVASKGSSSMTVSWSTNSNPATVSYYVEDVNNSSRNSGWISGTSYTFTSLTAETGYTFRVKAKNSAGTETSFVAMSGTEYTTGFTNNGGGGVGNPGDSKKPFGQIKIADTAHNPIAATNNRNIVILISPTDAATMSIVENNNPLSADFTSAVSQPVAYEKAWTLSTGDGIKCLHAQFANTGNTATYIATPACVTLDETAPEAPVVTEVFAGDGKRFPYIKGTSEAGARVAITQSAASQFLTGNWFASLSLLGAKSVTYGIDASPKGEWKLTFTDYFLPGSYTFAVTQQDKAKNKSPSATASMIVDKAIDPDVTGQIFTETIDGKKISAVNVTDINLHITSKRASWYLVRQTSTNSTPSFDGIVEQKITKSDFLVPVVLANEGDNCFHVRLLSEEKTKMFDMSRCVNLDRTPPFFELLSANPGTDTILPSITVRMDPGSYIIYSYAEFPEGGSVGSALERKNVTSQQSRLQLYFARTLALGRYEFAAQARDSVGNLSPVSRQIVTRVQPAPDLVPSGELSIVELKKGRYVNRRNINFQLTAQNTGLISILQTNDINSPDFSTTVKETLRAKRALILPSGDGQKCIVVRLYSKKGTQSRDLSTCAILDTTPPTKPVVTSVRNGTRREYALIRGTAEPLTTITVTYKKIAGLSALSEPIRLASLVTNGVSVHLAAVEQGVGTTVADGNGSWEFVLPTYTSGQYTITVKAEDDAGNISLPESGAVQVISETDVVTPTSTPTSTVVVATTTDFVEPETVDNQQDDVNGDGVVDEADTILNDTDQTVTQDDVLVTIENIFNNAVENTREFISRTVDGVREAIAPLSSVAEHLIANIRTAADPIVNTIQIVTDNKMVEEVNETVVVPVAAIVGVVNATASGLLQILTFLRFLFGQPLLLLRRRRLKHWGVVYNAFTKRPVDLATIRLFDNKTNRIIRSQVTDLAGRYLIIVKPGTYRLEVSRPGYAGFSGYLSKNSEDGTYTNLYHGQIFEVNEKNASVSYNIPLDPIGKSLAASQVIRDHALKSLQYVFSLAGVIVGSVSFIISPTPFVFGVFCFHFFLYVFFYIYAHRGLPGSYGVVSIINSTTPLHNTVVRLFDVTYNKLIDTKVTDKKGRYAFLVGPRSYYVTYEKPGFDTKKSPVLDFASQNTGKEGTIIHRNEQLSPISVPPNGNNSSAPDAKPSALTESLFSDLNEASESAPNQEQPEEESGTDLTSNNSKIV